MVRSYRKKRTNARQFVESVMVPRLFPKDAPARQFVRGTLFVVALSFLIIAAAGPRYGVFFEQVSRKGTDLYILLDVSRSMLAEDVAPSRLERAKSDINDLLGKIVGDRVGLIVFAGKPMIKVPLTTDFGFFLEVLHNVSPNSAPSGGTAIGDAVRRALAALPVTDEREQAIILITDGEDHESMPLDAAQAAAARKVRIVTVGLGDSTDGARIPVKDESGRKAYMMHDGHEVWSKVDQKTLQEMAQLTDGIHIDVGTRHFDLGAIYTDYLSRLKGGEFQTEERKHFRRQYQVFLTIGLLLLLGYLAVPECIGKR